MKFHYELNNLLTDKVILSSKSFEEIDSRIKLLVNEGFNIEDLGLFLIWDFEE